MDWTNWLPSFLQMPVTVQTVIVCWCVGYFGRGLPDKIRTQFVLDWAVMCTGVEMDIWLMPKSMVYAISTGIVCATISMKFYDMILSFIEDKAKKIFALLSNSPASPAPIVSSEAIRSMALDSSSPPQPTPTQK